MNQTHDQYEPNPGVRGHVVVTLVEDIPTLGRMERIEIWREGGRENRCVGGKYKGLSYSVVMTPWACPNTIRLHGDSKVII